MNVQVLSDQVLLNHYLSGDRSAISKLIERHSRRVKDYIHMMVKDRDVADDIFQETFIKAVRVIDEGRYTDNGKFLSWILRIAHNQVIDHFRAQRQNKSVSEAEAGYDVLGTLKLSERTVEDSMVCEQIERDVRALVELLPSEQREVVIMRYFSGLSFKEIAEQTDVSINTALGRMRYALINQCKRLVIGLPRHGVNDDEHFPTQPILHQFHVERRSHKLHLQHVQFREHPIPIRTPRRRRNETNALIQPHRIRMHPRNPRNL